MRYDETDQARRYDAARAMSREAQRPYLEPLARLVPKPTRRVVDLGCGTGRFSIALAESFGAPVLGVDPARTMLAKARANVVDPRVAFAEGDAGSIPLGDGEADLVFVSMAWHHVEDRAIAAREIHRILAPGGVLAIRNPTVDALDEVVFLEYFPAARAHDTATLPRRAELVALMESSGFTLALHEVIRHEMAPNWSAYCDKIAARAFSDLAVISDTAFESGLAAMRGESDRTGPIVEPIDLFAFRACAPL